MTTPDELLAALDVADGERCAALLEGLDEKARRELYPAVKERVAELETLANTWIEIPRQTGVGMRRGLPYEVSVAARLALLGTATLGPLKKTRIWTPYREVDLAVSILRDRRPEWLTAWAEFELERNFRTWPLVRALVREGVIERPETEFYILGMIGAPGTVSARALLEKDPELIGHELWRMFECEGSGELSLAARDKYRKGPISWSHAFQSLVAEGVIDRRRVLECTLDALQRDFAPFRAGWFSRLHEALKPAVPERVALRDRYLDLLTSRVPATVSFAVKALGVVHQAKALNVLEEAERLAPACEARDKGTVLRVLSLAAQASKSANEPSRRRLAEMAARALTHESTEVQKAALEVIGEHRNLIEPYLEALAPSTRAGLAGSAAEPEPALPPSKVKVPNAIEPIHDVTELIEAFAAVLENQGPPVELERVIDGVARVGIAAAIQDPDFRRKTAGLEKRAAKLSKSHPAQPRKGLAALALAWIRGERAAETAPKAIKSWLDFVDWRLWCLSEQAAARIDRGLLSLPTTVDGRIDPDEFDRRLSAWSADEQRDASTNPESLFHVDYLLAKLRAGRVERRQEPPPVIWSKRTWEWESRTYSHVTGSLDRGGGDRAPTPEVLAMATLWASLECKRWCATFDPYGIEGWFAAGCCELGGNLDWWQADWSTRAYLEPLLNPQLILGRTGALLMVLGLGAKEAGEAGLAVDALISSIGHSRLKAEALGEAMVEAARSGAIKFARWAKQLGKAAEAGLVQARAIFLALETLFASGVAVEETDFGRLLGLAVELGHMTGLRLHNPEAVRVVRKAGVGGGKGAETARMLVELN